MSVSVCKRRMNVAEKGGVISSVGEGQKARQEVSESRLAWNVQIL